jgi:hypothetical protein
MVEDIFYRARAAIRRADPAARKIGIRAAPPIGGGGPNGRGTIGRSFTDVNLKRTRGMPGRNTLPLSASAKHSGSCSIRPPSERGYARNAIGRSTPRKALSMQRLYDWMAAGHILGVRDFFFVGDGMKRGLGCNGSG